MIEIKKIPASETYPIRQEELRKNIPLPIKFEGDMDADTFHLGAFRNDHLIAISTFRKANHQEFSGIQYQLRGMATYKKYQGLGAAKLMMQEAFCIFKTLKVDLLWCNARIIAVDFYKKQGLLIKGEQFDLPFIGGHYLMYKKLDK